MVDMAPIRNDAAVSSTLNDVADEWQTAFEKAPDAVTSLAADVVKNSGKYFAPTAEVIGGGYVAKEAFADALNLIQGNDGSIFKASTSTTDKVVGTAIHSLLFLAGTGLAGHGVIKLAGNIAADIEKKG